ncbi:MAG: hypothetical protein V4736_04945 [Bdellovibrionota bacterium]
MASHKLTLGLSLLSVVMICTFLNQALMNNSTSADGSARGVASLHGTEDLGLQLRRLDSAGSVLTGERPSRLDQLVVGELKGQVHVELEGNKIVHLDWNRDARSAITKEQATQLVNDYRDQFAPGNTVFEFDPAGNVRTISILK